MGTKEETGLGCRSLGKDKRDTLGTERRHSYYIPQQRRASVGRGTQRTEWERLNTEEKLRRVRGKVAMKQGRGRKGISAGTQTCY